jgi:hypothetical protein
MAVIDADGHIIEGPEMLGELPKEFYPEGY